MSCSLLDKLATVRKNEGSFSMFGSASYLVDELREDDLGMSVSRRLELWQKKFDELTVLPLPVAKEIPTRLCPSFKAFKTEVMHSR